MLKPVFSLLIAVLCLTFSARLLAANDKALYIATDIPFVASVVQSLVGPNDEVVSVLSDSESPHQLSLRPSVAKSITQADLIILFGEDFTLGIAKAIERFAPSTQQLALLDVPELTLLPLRDDGAAHAAHAAHKHGNTAIDPHAWLNPTNVQQMVLSIRDALIEYDPPRTAFFTDNANSVIEQLERLDQELVTVWTASKPGAFVSLHDSTQYFEAHYGLQSVGTLFAGDHVSPSAHHVSELRQAIQQQGVTCLVTDPNTNARWVNTIAEGLNVSVVNIDVLGVNFEDSPTRYIDTLKHVSDSFQECLSVSG